ncbi:MAG: hypothetical protein RQ729_09730 [Wenzhouxiangellaceae bacterium]|nr:hypothetical protein [Wenzhouxiangellaceae bacterium]
MGEFLRRHLFIVLGVSLPLALIALVLIMQAAQRWGVAQPMTPVLYVHSADWVVREHLEVDVVDGRLFLSLRLPQPSASEWRLRGLAFDLAVYDPRSKALDIHAIEIDAADPVDAPEARLIPLAVPAELERLQLDPAAESPEGARLVVVRRSGGGLFGELFGFGRGGARYRLMIDEIGFDVPGNPVPYGQWPGFIAWVIEP